LEDGQALGRSRGGFSTKIHFKVDRDGLPLAFHLTAVRRATVLSSRPCLILDHISRPRAGVSDKGCTSARKDNRAAARERGIAPTILHKSNEKNRLARRA
jgi:hypothetical protein